MSEDPLDKAFDLAAASFFSEGSEQQELFDKTERLFFEKAALSEVDALPDVPRNPQYTAATLKKYHPEIYNLIVWMRLQAMPLRFTSEISGQCTNIISAIDFEIENNSDVETVRKALAGKSRYLARLSLERIEEILRERDQSDLDVGKLANLYKHLTEKSELLSGNATERVEWKPKKQEPTDYESYIQSAIPVEAEETHPAGEISGPCEGAADGPRRIEADQGKHDSGSEQDLQS